MVKRNIVATYACDVLVAGTGSTGMAATVRAAELGVNVICLEKHGEKALGGSSAMSAGILAIGSNIQIAAGETFTVQDVFRDAMDFHKHSCNAALLYKILEGSSAVIDWLEGLGVTFFDWTGGEKYQTAVFYHTEDTKHGFMGVGDCIRQLYSKAKEYGARFMFKTPLTELIVEEGRVLGAYAESPEGTIRIDAPVVILGTGGFANSKKMFDQYTDIDFNAITAFGCSGRDGDGIAAGIEVGAATHHLEALNFANPTLPNEGEGSYINNVGVNQPTCLWVNQSGKRFVSEESIFDWTLNGNSICQQSAFFSIIDSARVEDYRDNGPVNGVRLLIDPFVPVPDIQEHLDKKLESKRSYCFKADSIHELALLMGLDPKALVETVDEYNMLVEAGFDPLGKSAEYLRSISKPPFYGFCPKLAIFNTIGGLKVDEFARVLSREHFKPIPGLYAAGCDGGGMFGGNYDMTIGAGTMQAWCTGGGKMAAEHAVQDYLRGEA